MLRAWNKPMEGLLIPLPNGHFQLQSKALPHTTVTTRTESIILELSNLLTEWLTHGATALLDKIKIPQLLKDLHTFYGTWNFITMFTAACHLCLSPVRWIQSTSSHYFIEIHFNIIFHSMPRSSKWPLSFITVQSVQCKILTAQLQADTKWEYCKCFCWSTHPCDKYGRKMNPTNNYRLTPWLRQNKALLLYTVSFTAWPSPI